nr:MAG TPA: hypothetical protein [Caudoviricetes sp.]
MIPAASRNSKSIAKTHHKIYKPRDRKEYAAHAFSEMKINAEM